MGRKGNAVESLERAVEMGLTDVALLEENADLESLRDHKGFRRLMEKLENTSDNPRDGW